MTDTGTLVAILQDECRGLGLILPPKDIWEWFGLGGKMFQDWFLVSGQELVYQVGDSLGIT